jgi:hypothetical protein
MVDFSGATQTVWGLDVAEQGKDLFVLTRAVTDGVHYAVIGQQHIGEWETIPTANHLALLFEKMKPWILIAPM